MNLPVRGGSERSNADTVEPLGEVGVMIGGEAVQRVNNSRVTA